MIDIDLLRYNAGNLIPVSAELAQTAAVGSNGLLRSTHGQRVALVEGLALGIGVIDLTKGRPVHIAVTQRGNGSFLHLLRHGVEVVASNTADQQGDDSHHNGDSLGLLVQILIGQHQNDNGHKGNDADHNAHVVPQPELELVLLRRGIDAVGLLPELGTNDHAGQIQHQEGYQGGQ